MTKIAYHLICDCGTAVNSFSCSQRIKSPTVDDELVYLHCPYCNFDFTCNQAVKQIFVYDEKDIPVGEKKLCRRCNTELEEYFWPSNVEALKTYSYENAMKIKNEKGEEITSYS